MLIKFKAKFLLSPIKCGGSMPEVEHPHDGRRGDEAAQPEGRHQAPGELRGGEGGGRAAAANQM